MEKYVLDVYMHDELVGKLAQDISGRLSFTYLPAYLQTAKIALSISLPLQSEKFSDNIVKPFFSGLLPDDIVRDKLAKYLGISAGNPFAMLQAIGGECAGALSFYDEGKNFNNIINDHSFQILEDAELKKKLMQLQIRPLLAGEDGMRLSLAGAQDKLAVIVKEGKIALAKNVPTTHILKPPIITVTDSVHNEFFCMQLAKKLGITVPHAQIKFAEDMPFFMVERYDRLINKDGSMTRLHQEDFCQAMGIMPHLKYERENGPNIKTCQELIQKYSARPAIDSANFLKIIIFNYLIGNADAHGKNFSLLYNTPKPQLAPAYDLLSTAIYPEFSNKMAMRIGSKYKPEEVLLRHWHAIVPDTEVARNNLEKQLKLLSQEALKQADSLILSLKKQGIRSMVFDKIIAVITDRSNRLK